LVVGTERCLDVALLLTLLKSQIKQRSARLYELSLRLFVALFESLDRYLENLVEGLVHARVVKRMLHEAAQTGGNFGFHRLDFFVF